MAYFLEKERGEEKGVFSMVLGASIEERPRQLLAKAKIASCSILQNLSLVLIIDALMFNEFKHLNVLLMGSKNQQESPIVTASTQPQLKLRVTE